MQLQRLHACHAQVPLNPDFWSQRGEAQTRLRYAQKHRLLTFDGSLRYFAVFRSTVFCRVRPHLTTDQQPTIQAKDGPPQDSEDTVRERTLLANALGSKDSVRASVASIGRAPHS